MKVIDLRSDTVTRPTPEMRQAMARAEVGDDVYGEDPTVRRLEERAADLLGKEAALFVPTGTMANQIAVGLVAGRGDEVICETGSHLYGFEGGGLAALWGAQARPLDGDRGVLDPAAVEEAIRPDDPHHARTRAVAIENTHNRGGGRAWPLAAVRAVGEVAARRGLALHVDGARLLNAAVATGTSPRDCCAPATTAAICFSKGLGAPAGSAVAASRDLVREARRLRKRLGGGMRQAGVLAAGCLHALDHHVARLAEDHAHARRLGALLATLPGARLAFPVETNLLFVAFADRNAAELAVRFREAGVLCGAEASRPDTLRLVTHLDVSAEDVEEAARRMARVLGA
ncbi:MAG TPA: low-specificity L-threonine aldolase [Anaeromyxobacteraceae bacterium]|nr:low-specificity L-threonine aldolase [Anaeromyxobacteraceae bacterium]